MGERGKAVEAGFNYSAASEFPCRKHPNASSVGICAHCLKDRLAELICSECGERRRSSCSCSDVSSSYRNSCSTLEVGSVGRVSFLIESEKTENRITKRGEVGSEQVIFLRRSSNSCVEVKKSNGFWRVKRLFRRRSKGRGRNGESCDERSEIWVSDFMGVSRSRSLCSFISGGGNDLDEGSECAKISDVTSGILLDSDKQFGFFDDSEPRRSGFKGMDESAFIDLKLELAAELKEVAGAGAGGRRWKRSDDGGNLANVKSNGGDLANVKSNGGYCRITVNERGLKRSHKLWKWIFKYSAPKNGVVKS